MDRSMLEGALRSGSAVYLGTPSGEIVRLLPYLVNDRLCLLVDSQAGLQIGAPTVCVDLEHGLRLSSSGRFGYSGCAISAPERRGGVAQPVRALAAAAQHGMMIVEAGIAGRGSPIEARFLHGILNGGTVRPSFGLLHLQVRLATESGDWYEVRPDPVRFGSWIVTEFPASGAAPNSYPARHFAFAGVGSTFVVTTESGVLQTAPIASTHVRRFVGNETESEVRFRCAQLQCGVLRDGRNASPANRSAPGLER